MPAQWKNRTVLKCGYIVLMFFKSKTAVVNSLSLSLCIENYRITCALTAFWEIYLFAVLLRVTWEDQRHVFYFSLFNKWNLAKLEVGKQNPPFSTTDLLLHLNISSLITICSFMGICKTTSWLIFCWACWFSGKLTKTMRLVFILQQSRALMFSVCPSVHLLIQSILLTILISHKHSLKLKTDMVRF